MISRQNGMAIGAGLAIFIGVIWASGLLGWANERGQELTLPLIRIVAGIGQVTGSIFRPRGDVTSLQKKVTELEQDRLKLAVDYAALDALKLENADLKKLAHFSTSSQYELLGAQVIARSTDPQQASLFIDRGSKDGVELGLAVVADEGVLIGKITSLNERIATVTLISDPKSRVAGAISGQQHLIGLVGGEGTGVIHLDLIPQSEPLEEGQLIVTSGTENKIPGSLPIALVRRVDGKATDAFKTATLESLVDLDWVRRVFVMHPSVLHS